MEATRKIVEKYAKLALDEVAPLYDALAAKAADVGNAAVDDGLETLGEVARRLDAGLTAVDSAGAPVAAQKARASGLLKTGEGPMIGGAGTALRGVRTFAPLVGELGDVKQAGAYMKTLDAMVRTADNKIKPLNFTVVKTGDRVGELLAGNAGGDFLATKNSLGVRDLSKVIKRIADQSPDIDTLTYARTEGIRGARADGALTMGEIDLRAAREGETRLSRLLTTITDSDKTRVSVRGRHAPPRVREFKPPAQSVTSAAPSRNPLPQR
jgi:hypothetical protein